MQVAQNRKAHRRGPEPQGPSSSNDRPTFRLSRSRSRSANRCRACFPDNGVLPRRLWGERPCRTKALAQSSRRLKNDQFCQHRPSRRMESGESSCDYLPTPRARHRIGGSQSGISFDPAPALHLPPAPYLNLAVMKNHGGNFKIDPFLTQNRHVYCRDLSGLTRCRSDRCTKPRLD